MASRMTHTQRVRTLYKTILRLHRGLPAELRDLGDKYTKDEFRRHKSCNPSEAVLFMTEWTKYTLSLSEQLGLRGKQKGPVGAVIAEEELQHLRDEQVVQLYELMMAAKYEESESRQPDITNGQQK